MERTFEVPVNCVFVCNETPARTKAVNIAVRVSLFGQLLLELQIDHKVHVQISSKEVFVEEDTQLVESKNTLMSKKKLVTA